MKKVLAILLALAMSASATMIAFAEDYDQDDAVVDTDTTVIEEAGTADTNVDILVNSTNISVTVPVKYAVVADVKGGECLEPTNYYIQNNSAIAVDIVNAVVTDKNANWKLVEATTATVPAGENELDMTLTADSKAWNLYNTYTEKYWQIDPATTTGGTKLEIAIEANSSMLNTTANAEAAFTITYTFAAAETTTD